MPVSSFMRRLLHIRELEEEQCRLQLDGEVGELRRLEGAIRVVTQRDRIARASVTSGIENDILTDRVAGLEESSRASRLSELLVERANAIEQSAEELRRSLLLRRTDRLQIETLIQDAAAKNITETGRRIQQTLDDWHNTRRFQSKGHSSQHE